MWTRNYQNLLNTAVSCGNEGAATKGATSANAFGDAYLWNFKAPSGDVYEIATYNSSSSYDYYESDAYFIRNAGGSISKQIEMVTQPTTTSPSLNYSISVGFGSSGEAATFEDYKLHSHITSGFSTLSKTVQSTLNTDGTVTLDYKIIISASADLTIQEIGIFKVIYYLKVGSSSPSNYARYALINRIVLDEPVSVAANQTSTITFSITTPKITLG